MKVLSLQCARGHGFEGWFASEDDFQAQQGQGLLSCPVCDVPEVIKLPSAPRLNLGRPDSLPDKLAPTPPPAELPEHPAQQLHAAWMGAVRRVLAQTEDVGHQFAEEARRMHYGEIEQRAIRGKASLSEAQALNDEGIEVALLPVLPGLDEPLQ